MAVEERRIRKFRCIVERNGEAIDFNKVNFVRDASRLAPTWTITLPYPILISKDDTWTIKRGFGGSLWTLVNSQVAQNLRYEDGYQAFTRTVQGEGSNSDTYELLNYCVPKTLVFVNQTWLSDVSPYAKLKDGIIKLCYGTDYAERYYHYRLPSKDVPDDEFECVLGSWTHHSIAQYLAGLLGYDITLNTPDMEVIDTFTVQVGTPWFDAIKSNFLIWQAVFESSGTNLYVLDILSDAAEIPGIQKLTFSSRKAIRSVSVNDKFDGSTVDHVIVKGRTTKNTTTSFPKKVPMKIIEVPQAVRFMEEYEEFEEELKSPTQHKKLGAYNGPWGKSEEIEYNIKHLGKNVHRLEYFKSKVEPGEKWKVLRHIVKTYFEDGELKSKLTMENHYGRFDQIIGSETTFESKFRLPGEALDSQPQMRTIQNHIIKANRFVVGVNTALTSELTEGLVLYEEDSKGNKLDPVPLMNLLQQDWSRTAVDWKEDTKQDVEECDIKAKSEFVHRGDLDTILWITVEYDYLSDAPPRWGVKSIKNPLDSGINSTSEKIPFIRNYYEGEGKMIGTYGPCYRRPVTISHDDIQTDEIAEALADRAFGRRGPGDTGETLKELDIKLATPLPIESIAIVATMPSVSYTVRKPDGDVDSVTVPAADHIVRRYSEDISYTGNLDSRKLGFDATLTVRSKF
jgi:hypothetical protein